MRFEEAKQFILLRLENELPKNLSYHSLVHILDVYNIANTLGVAEGLDEHEMTLLRTAVLFHDSGFIKGPIDHEIVSCRLAREHLPEFDYKPDEILKIEGMIMATQIPQKPHNLLEQVICDSDLDYLGRDDFWAISNKLYSELYDHGKITNKHDWNNQQISFFEKHQYFTKSSKSLRDNKKAQNLEEIKTQFSQGTSNA
jgi:uncharacterized protein